MLPADLYGDLLIPEPVGRVIRRAKVTNTNGEVTLRNAYDKQEFIASNDLNFRPVNTATGPDGCLYIVDMYHGIIQESNWTRKGTFLRNKIENKGLQKNIGRGRIYRLVHDDYKPNFKKKPNLYNETSTQLVQHFSTNLTSGWWRDEAQKLLEGVLDKAKPEPKVLLELGKLYYDNNDAEKAAELFELGHKVEPYSSQWLTELSRAWALAGQKEKLIAVLKELVATDADDLETRQRLAKLCLETGKAADAEKYARECLEINIRSDDGREVLFKALAEQKKNAEAERLRKVLDH